jgi:hypothetical protein
MYKISANPRRYNLFRRINGKVCYHHMFGKSVSIECGNAVEWYPGVPRFYPGRVIGCSE